MKTRQIFREAAEGLTGEYPEEMRTRSEKGRTVDMCLHCAMEVV